MEQRNCYKTDETGTGVHKTSLLETCLAQELSKKRGGNENGLGQTQFLKASRSPDVLSSRERQRERESGPPEAKEEKNGHCVPRSRDV